MTRAREAVLRLFHLSENRTSAFEPLPAIFPGYSAPIVRQAEDGERELVTEREVRLIVAPGGRTMRQRDKQARRAR